MTDTITKGLMGRGDASLYDGIALTTTRADGAGGSVTITKLNDYVDVMMVYGSGTDRTSAALQAAITAIGSTNVALLCAPGTWTISADVTVPSNATLVVPAGCVFSVATSKTLTINGVLWRQHATYTAGAGTVDVSGATDVLTSSDYASGYAADTGTANAYAIAPSPAITAYAAGQTFRFKPTNTNTGASTLAVNGLTAKPIKQADGSTALEAGDLIAGQIAQVSYESTGDEFHLMPTRFPDSATAVVTARGELIRGDSSGAPEPLALGSAGQAVVSDGTDAVWGRPYGIVQSVTATDDTYQTTTASIPVDDTVPQNTEGTEIETVAITPTHADNLLIIEADVPVHITTSGTAAIALFQDATAGALAASWLGPDGAHNGNLRLVHTMTAGTTSATTFKIRVGTTAGSLVMNGNASNRIFGGVMVTRLRVLEIKSNG